MMQGLSLQSLKKHKASGHVLPQICLIIMLIPLYVCVGAGCVGAVLYTARLAISNPDVQWNRNGVVSNEQYREKQYKFYSPNYPNAQSSAPKY